MGTRKHPRTTSHPGLPWFGDRDVRDDAPLAFLHSEACCARELGGAGAAPLRLLTQMRPLWILRNLMKPLLMIFSLFSLVSGMLYSVGYSLAWLADSTLKLAWRYSVRCSRVLLL
jgi:hypothetical protein